MWIKIALLYGVLPLIALLILIILLRTLFFKDRTNYKRDVEEITNKDDVVYKLGEMLKIPTVSHEDRSQIDYDQFKKYKAQT